MSKSFAIPICVVALTLFALTSIGAQELDIVIGSAQDSEHDGTAPAHDPPQIVVASAIDDDENLVLVNFRTIYIGFSGESYNNRSSSRASLSDVSIFTVKGERVTIAEAREQIAGKDTPVLCSSWNTPLPQFYVSMFSPETLHFVFPKESPVWKKIQEPGRPIR